MSSGAGAGPMQGKAWRSPKTGAVRDREEGKTTFVDILGLNGCQRVIEAHSESAVEALGDMEDTDFLIHLVRVLEKREQ